MERKVIFRDRQELDPLDPGNLQDWADEAHKHLITDAITTQKQYVGLTVTIRSASELAIAPGRLYGSDGDVFALNTEFVASVFAMLPPTNQKWVAISVFGQQENTDYQTRDFLIDLETRQTEPDSVAMEQRKVVIVHLEQGLESVTPQKPAAPTGYTLIAHARLSPSGIQEIVLADINKLPNLHNVNTRVKELESWQAATRPRIDHIMSDVAGLGEAVAARATVSQALQLAMDMARVKERLELPDNYVFYGADHFLDETESATATGGYSARCDEGLRPAFVGTASSALALLNPLDSGAAVSEDGFLLPAYAQITRLAMEDYEGDVTINSFQFQTTNMVQRTMSRERIQYGEPRSVCTNSGFWRGGVYDPITGIFMKDGEEWEIEPAYRQNMIAQTGIVRGSQRWVTTYQAPYWEAETTTHAVNGAILAQTLLSAQTGWLTSVDLYFTNVSASGGLTLALVDATTGQPDLNNAIARQTFAVDALNLGWCRLTWARPVFVEAGKRYALVLISSVAHHVGYTNGTDYTQGVMLYLNNGGYEGLQADRDLMLRLQFAQFNTPRAVIQMAPLQLAGGIGDIDLLYEGVVPDGCELIWEYQLAGIWYQIREGTAENMASLAALLPIRAVFVGTRDVQPGIRLIGSRVIVSRVGTTFTHFSTERTLATASDHIIVRLLLEDFDADDHDVTCQLIISGSPEDPTSTQDQVVDSRSFWREFVFELGSTTTEYTIKITGSTDDWRSAWHVAERYDLAL